MAAQQEPSPRVLIVDDGPDELMVLETLLQREGFTVVTADHGRRGVELAQQNPPDLVLLDLQMPVLDGFGVLSILKSETATQDIPVIVVSGSTAERDIVRALNLGATDYVTKPYAIEILLARIRVALRSHLEKQAIWRLGEDLRNAQEELARARRSMAMGALAAALAHEINNPAAFVVADLHEVRELAHDLLEAGDEERGETLAALADESLQGMNRIRDVVRDLSVFASVGDEESAPHSGVLDLSAVAKRRAERAGVPVRGADDAVLVPASSGEDELDAMVGLLIRHVSGGENKVVVRVERSGRYACLHVVPTGEAREPPSDALSLTIARELAERFGGTIESGNEDGAYVLKLNALISS
jgi:DNA-binding response OmpR family regulator